MTGADSMHYTGNSKLVLWDNPEGWAGEAGGRGSGWWDTYTPMADSCQFSSVQLLSRVRLDPMNRSTPGLPVHHQFLKFTQTHVHRVSDAIQPSHPLSSPSPPAPNPSQHQSLFQ